MTLNFSKFIKKKEYYKPKYEGFEWETLWNESIYQIHLYKNGYRHTWIIKLY